MSRVEGFVVILALFLVASCQQEEAGRTDLRPEIAAAARVTAPDRTVLEGVVVSRENGFSWSLGGPVEGVLRFSWTVDGGPARAKLVTHLDNSNGDRVSRPFDRELLQAPGQGVMHEEVPLNREVRSIQFESQSELPILLSDIRIVSPDESSDAVVLILIDTLRRDAVGLYGSTRPTTPRLDAIFSSAWKAEAAYAPASWTTPSVASLFSGLVPERLESSNGSPLGIPAEFGTIAEEFSADGWSTGAFVANPVINVDAGFADGFSAFYVAPYEFSSMELPGTTVLDRAASWLRGHSGERVFLYLHLIDPHEPYHAPDRDLGFTPFDPDYSGGYNGRESHAALSFDLNPTEEDVAHLRALYDDGVRYADSIIGAFWDGLPQGLRKQATVVLTSDHGEEFFDHGAWKHGPTLYDEVLAIPLLIRSPHELGRLDAERLITLTDLGPTLGAMFGLQRPDGFRDGLDQFAPDSSHSDGVVVTMLTGGAARTAVVTENSKLVFFDRLGTRGIPDQESDPMGYRLAYHLRNVLPDLGRFDLGKDPLETVLLEPDPATFLELWRMVEASIAHTRAGIELRWFPRDAGETARIRLQTTEDTRSEGFALEVDDRIEIKGDETLIRLGTTRGVDVDGVLLATGSDLMIALDQDSSCLEIHSGDVAVVGPGESVIVRNGDVPAALPRFEQGESCSALYFWKTEFGQSRRQTGDESTRRLRALGYIH